MPVVLGGVNIANRETEVWSDGTGGPTLRVSTGSPVAVYCQNGDALEAGDALAALVGVSARGTGVIAAAPNPAGRALQVRGRVAFALAGLVEIPRGSTNYTFPDIRIGEGWLMLAQLQGYAGRDVYVRYCRRLGDGTFHVQLSNATTTTGRLAYLILEAAPALTVT
jgi:hypothetical protein